MGVFEAILMTMLAVHAERPACNAETSGAIWPRTVHAGVPMEVCTLRVWKYRWTPVTVSYPDLVREADSRRGKRRSNGTPPVVRKAPDPALAAQNDAGGPD